MLARIDAPDVGRATAELLRARGRGEATARKLARQLELEKQGATSSNAIDEARAEDRAARAELTAARTMLATLGAAEPRVEDDGGAPPASRAVSIQVAIKAPIAGVIVQRSAVLGGAVAPDRSLFHLIDPARLLVRAKLPETAGALPTAGASASISTRAAGGRDRRSAAEAAVMAGFGAVDESTRTVPIRLRPSGPCPWLLPGAYVDVLLAGGATSPDRASRARVDRGPRRGGGRRARRAHGLRRPRATRRLSRSRCASAPRWGPRSSSKRASPRARRS